jgi:hypothetical protein
VADLLAAVMVAVTGFVALMVGSSRSLTSMKRASGSGFTRSITFC